MSCLVLSNILNITRSHMNEEGKEDSLRNLYKLIYWFDYGTFKGFFFLYQLFPNIQSIWNKIVLPFLSSSGKMNWLQTFLALVMKMKSLRVLPQVRCQKRRRKRKVVSIGIFWHHFAQLFKAWQFHNVFCLLENWTNLVTQRKRYVSFNINIGK